MSVPGPGEHSSDETPITADFLSHPATQSTTPLPDLGFRAGSNPPDPQAQNIRSLAPIRGGPTASDFVTQPTPILDSGLGTPAQIQQIANSSIPSPDTFMRGLLPDPIPDDFMGPGSSIVPAIADIQPVASPRTWAQIARGDPVKALAPAAKPRAPASKAPSAALNPTSPAVPAAPGTTPAAWRSSTGKPSATPGPRGGTRNLGSPFKPRNVRSSGLSLPQQQAGLTTSVPRWDGSTVPLQINSAREGNQGPRPEHASQRIEAVVPIVPVGTPDVSVLGARTVMTEPAQPPLLPTGRPVGVGGFPGSLDPVEGTSFTQRHSDPRIQSFAPKGGLERLNRTRAAVAIQEHARGRSSSPPSVDLSAPSTGTLNLRTGLDSLNEFNQNYGHHVKGAIRQARSISGAPPLAPSSVTAPGGLDSTTASCSTIAEVGISQTEPVLPGAAAPGLVLDTELYGTTTTHENGQKFWQCKLCAECPPLMAGKNAGRGWIAKHIKGHLKGDRHDPIPRQIVPPEAAQPAVPPQHQSGPSSLEQTSDGLWSHGAFMVDGIQGSPFPESGTQFGWPSTCQPAVGSGLGHPGPQPSQEISEYNQSVGSQLPARGFAQNSTQGGPLVNPRSTAIGHQGYHQGTPLTGQQTHLYNPTAHQNQQFGQAAIHVAHFSQHGSQANPINLDAPVQQMQTPQATLSHLVSEFNRTGYATVPNADFTDFGGAPTPAVHGPATSNNQGWVHYMNYQSPPPLRQQAPQWLLNTAAPGVSDRGSPPAPNMGAGVMGHFHSGGYRAPVSPGPFPYTGYIGPGAFGTPPLQTPRTPAHHVGNLYAHQSPQPAPVGLGGGPYSPIPQPENLQQFPAVTRFSQPITSIGDGFVPSMVPTAADFDQNLAPGEFQPGAPLVPVMSSHEEQELIDELLQENMDLAPTI